MLNIFNLKIYSNKDPVQETQFNMNSKESVPQFAHPNFKSQKILASVNTDINECYKQVGSQFISRRGRTWSNPNGHGPKNPEVSGGWCYRYVKLMLSHCGTVQGYLAGASAKNAGPQLKANGFVKLKTLNPHQAQEGSIIVYGNSCKDSNVAGHIEIKTAQNEYISDYKDVLPRSDVTSCRRVTGIYYKN